MATLTGALYLARVGEQAAITAAGGREAMLAGMQVASQQGDEGRALALLTLYKAQLSPNAPETKDASDHLAALDGWIRDTVGANTAEARGDAERIAVSRALLEPTPEATEAARAAVAAWVQKALELHEGSAGGAGRPKREDAIEAYRAMRSGGQVLAALYLRSGDAARAYNETSSNLFRRVTPPPLVDRIEAVASGGDASAWRDLLIWMWAPQRRRDGAPADANNEPEFEADPSLIRAALWGTAVEAYRRDPTQLDVAMALAALLSQQGMAEVAPLVLADAVALKADATRVSAAMRFLLQIILTEDEAEDPESARRVFAAAESILSLARRAEYQGRIDPSAARVQMAMGDIEMRAANLSEARRLLEGAVRVEPSVRALVTLATIERQSDKLPEALTTVTRAIQAPDAKRNHLAVAEARLLAFEIQRQLGAVQRAREELSQALASALQARSGAADAAQRSSAERVLARVLDRFSDPVGASRALERAFAAAGEDRHQVTVTVLETAARALLMADPIAGRKAVERALAARVGDDDLVYPALWLQFVERSAKKTSDGAASRTLASIHDDGRWPGRLASWALGKIKDQDLLTSARTPGQKTEATFYISLARRAGADQSAAANGFQQVVSSPAVGLMEVQLARDLVAGAARNLAGPPPYTAP